MLDTPRLPDDSVNVSKMHPLKDASLLVGGLVVVLLVLFL